MKEALSTVENFQSIVSKEKLSPHGLSFSDRNGRLFKSNKKLYRVISKQSTKFYRKLFDQGIIQNLIAKNLLIETEIADLEVKDYELVLEHRTIPFVSYPQEWCDEMLRDAALFHLDLCIELASNQLTTQDAHPLNILFDGYRPIFIDFCSIIALENQSWPAEHAFNIFFMNPLRLMAKGHTRTARWLLHDYDLGVQNSDLEDSRHKKLVVNYKKNILNYGEKIAEKLRYFLLIFFLRRFMSKKYKPPSMIDFFRETQKKIMNLTLFYSHINFSPQSNQSPIPSESYLIQKIALTEQIINDLKPNSILDISGSLSQGSYSKLAASIGCRNVIMLSPDELLIKNMYIYAKTNKLSILPLIGDFSSPIWNLSNEWVEPAHERLKCEMVLVFSVIDDLIFDWWRSFELIVTRLSLLSKRWVLIEFILDNNKIFDEPHLAWYSLHNFIKALKNKFCNVTTISMDTESRVLILCEKQ
ncbi:MAG: hypothetical protein DCF12_02340 [Snowella sp.]|jgi:hypothetical protein|nr:MAG: hypothetical protein DCF12_02340 [Snowella sp.]